MGSKKAFLFVSAIFFVVFICYVNKAAAQKNGSLYFSVGYNEAWYGPATIHIEQNDLGNSYDMLKVAGDSKTHTAISLLQLNYRIGYYYNYEQTWGVEANFDPVNYHITDGPIVRIKGTINNTPNIKENIIFSAAKGYYYYFNGANLLLLNLVRRFQVYKPNSNKVRLDILAKVGVGPALPHFVNSLPVYPVADPQLQFGGLNAGAELALRVTVYRYLYAEFAGKYDYASFNALNVYDGTARQNLQTYEVIASLGFTFPTTRNNPLFRTEKKIVTILPFYQQSKLAMGENAKKDDDDSTDNNMFKEIPPFQDILDKEAKEADDKYRLLHPPDTFTNADSIVHADSVSRVDSIARVDSIVRQDSADHVSDSLNSRKERKRRKHQQNQDTVSNAQLLNPDSTNTTQQVNQDSLNKATQAPPQQDKPKAEAPPDAAVNNVVPADTSGKISKKEEKKKAKEDKKEAKRKEKEEREKAKEEEQAKKKGEEEAAAQKAQEEAAAKQKAQEEEDAKKKADQEKEDKDKQETPPDKKDGR